MMLLIYNQELRFFKKLISMLLYFPISTFFDLLDFFIIKYLHDLHQIFYWNDFYADFYRLRHLLELTIIIDKPKIKIVSKV